MRNALRYVLLLALVFLACFARAQDFLESSSIPVADLFPPALKANGSFAIERADFCLCYETGVPSLDLDPLCIEFTDTYIWIFDMVVSHSPLGCLGSCPCVVNCSLLENCDNPACFSNPVCQNCSIEINCVNPICASSPFCNNCSLVENCDNPICANTSTCDCSTLLPAPGTPCSVGTGPCAGNGTYACNMFHNATICSVTNSTADASVISVVTTSEYDPSTWIFDIYGNYTICEVVPSRMFSYVTRAGKYQLADDVSIYYGNVEIQSFTVTGDCTPGPLFSDYSPYPELNPGNHTLFPANAVAHLNVPVINGFCHVQIVASSIYFYTSPPNSRDVGESTGCVNLAAGSQERAHDVAIVINSVETAASTTNFTRCPLDMEYVISVNLNSAVPFRLRFTFDFVYWDIADKLSEIANINSMTAGQFQSCVFTTTDNNVAAVPSFLFTIFQHYMLADTFPLNVYQPPALPAHARVTAVCALSIAPANFGPGTLPTNVVNTIIPKVGPYKDASYGYAGLGESRVIPDDVFTVAPAMIHMTSVTNSFQISGGTFTTGANCGDNIKNGAETAVDCGGPTCVPCVNGLACAINSDCISRSCVGLICVP